MIIIKPYKNLYEKIYDFEMLLMAFDKAKLGRRYQNDVMQFNYNLEENLIDLQNHLIHKSYEVGKYHEFFVYDPKKRLIMSLPFKDRVLQWAIYMVLNPIFSKGYINDSHGCIKGKGIHSAVQRLKYWLRIVNKDKEKYYYLKLDISKYYYRIDHEILLNIIKRKIDDDDLICLLEKIIKSEEQPFGLPIGSTFDETEQRLFDRGIPIGNLTSQMFANIYLNELDQYIKHTLKVKYFIRYMDDMIILHHDKKLLYEYKMLIEEFLQNELKLNLNNKTAIRPISLGIDFVGYKVWPTYIKLRKSSALKMKRKLKIVQKDYSKNKISFERANATVQSYLGILKHCNSYNLKNKIFKDFVLKKQ
ncbi:MAG: reverse transcriptase domain-containing protein [Bacilli bacterium]